MPSTMQYTYTAQSQPGKKVDLSGLFSAIGSKPKNEFNKSEYRDAINAQRTAGDLNTPRTFTLDNLLNAINQAKNTGQPVEVPQARFQTTEQISNLIGQMNDVLKPLTEAQKNAATTGYNTAMQDLQNKWASRGLLASGAAAAQERQGANQLSSQLANIEAQQQANAIPLALNFADLGLREDAQRFSQQANNRDFLAQQMQNYVNNLLSGTSQESQQRQFQQQFEQNRAQQFADNMMKGLQFDETQLQNYLNNLANAYNMEIAQNQWAQNFGQNQQAQDFNQWLQTQQLDMNKQAQDFAQQQQNWENRFNFGKAVGQFGNGQKTLDAIAQEAALSGMYNGNPTFATQQAILNALQNYAGMTPYLPSGMGNVASQLPAFGSLADFLNQLAGQPSQSTWTTNANNAQRAWEIMNRPSSSGESGGNQLPGTETERRNLATSELLNSLMPVIQSTNDDGGRKYSLENALSMLLEPQIQSEIIRTGADPSVALNAIFEDYTGMAPDQYLAQNADNEIINKKIKPVVDRIRALYSIKNDANGSNADGNVDIGSFLSGK